jgi:uncharacterized protein YodC (DUF2158 family)
MTTTSATTEIPAIEKLHEFYFELGDTVKLRAIPGPEMIVHKKHFVGIGKDRKIQDIETTWFDTTGKRQKDTFHYRDLQVVARARKGVA